MQKLKYILLTLVLSLTCVAALAQEENVSESELIKLDETTRADDGKVIRGSYLTNEWYDNWVFGGAIGAQTLWAPGNHGMMFTPRYEISVIKWITPSIAISATPFGFSLKERRAFEYVPGHSMLINEDGVNLFRQTYGFDLGVMWNVSSAFFGYKPRRFWTCSPFITTGYIRLTDTNGEGNFFKPSKSERWYMDQEFTMGLGVYNTFRISDHVNATLKISDAGLRTAYHTVNNPSVAHNLAVTAGVNYTIHKWYWSRYTTRVTPLRNSYNAAKTALADAQELSKDLKRKNDDLSRKNKELEKTLGAMSDVIANTPPAYDPDELQKRASKAGLIIYFEKNVDKIATGEAIRIEEYVREVCEQDPHHVFYITGSADAGTGNYTINTRLSRDRGINVKKYLCGKLHVPASQVVLKPAIISSKHTDGRLDRCVLFENE